MKSTSTESTGRLFAAETSGQHPGGMPAGLVSDWGSLDTAGWVANKPLAVSPPTNTYQMTEAATGLPLPGRFADATPSQIDQAAVLSEQAFGTLRQMTGVRRAELLTKVADLMESRREAICDRCQLETGYVPPRVAGEFERTVMQLRLFAKLAQNQIWDQRHIDPAQPDRKPFSRHELRRRLLPVGPIAVMGACNFPLAISVVGNDFVAAIAVGCPVIVKSHPSHAGTCELLARVVCDAIEETGFPPGTFALLHGRANDTTLALVCHASIAAIGFTGSPGGGRAVADAALQRESPIPVFAELGSTNPVFIAPGAGTIRLPSIAKGLVASLRFGNGHMCTKPGIVVMLKDHAEAFGDALSIEVDPLTPLPLLSESVAIQFDQTVKSLRSTNGIEVVIDDSHQSTAGTKGPWNRGLHVLSCDASTAKRHQLLSSETFGPITMIVKCNDTAQMLDIARQYNGSLTTTLHSDQGDREFVDAWLEVATLFAGRIIHNGWPTGMEIGPATHHGGPYPATLSSLHTSIGYASVQRFLRPVSFQNWSPGELTSIETTPEPWSKATGPIA